MVAAENLRETTVEVADASGYRRNPPLNYFMTRYTAAYAAEIAAFVAAMNEGVAVAPTGNDGLKALLIADAATLSAEEGRVVRLD